MIYLDWKVGDRIVCVDDAAHERYTPYQVRGDWGLDGLERGRVYTIRAIGTYGGAIVVWLKEITRRPDPRNFPEAGEPGFACQRFRKVQPRETDISVFTAMLHDVKRSEPVMLSTPWGRVPA